MKTVVVLAMHGSPPKDFPRDEMMEFFGLHARLEQVRGPADPAARRRHDALEAKMREWPRTAENDPFFAASQAMARSLGKETGREVVVGFNEFCAPDLDTAIDRAVEAGAGQVVVVTPMLTRGGEHAELEITQVVEQAQARYPNIRIQYAWPFEVGDVARFLAAQVSRFV